MASPVVHFEIVGKDGKALQAFYKKIFGWKIDANNPMNYGMVDTGARARKLGGGVGPTMGGAGWVTVYVQVDDTDKALKKIEKAGGKTLMPTTKVPKGPTIAQFADPEGNRVGLIKA